MARLATMLTFTVCVAALTVMTAPAMAQTSKVKILKVDSTDFPKVRVYIQVPSASWAKAEATVEFTEKAPASVKRALEEKKKDPAEKNLPAAPEHQVAAKLKAFQDQRDPAEALLVIFMLDASSSMVGPPERETRKANHQAAIEMVKAIIRQQLRSVDRITLVKFTDKPDRFYGPHANRDAAIIALDKDYTQLKGGTRIYDSLDAVLDKYIAAVETPTLPHRRIAVVISDGRDTESNMAADRLATKFRADTKSGILVTFGVGASEKKRRKRYRDLANLASLAGRQANFSPEGTPAAAVSTFQGAIAPLEKQVEVNFEVPLYHWQKGKQDLVLSLRRDGKVTHVTVQVDLTNMTEEQLKKGADYRAQLKELTVVVVEEKEEKKWQIYAAIGGGIFLLLLIILIIASKSRKKAALERRRRIDALEAGMSTQIAAQEQRLVQQMEDQRIAAEEEARRAAEAARVTLATLVGMEGPLKGHRYEIKDPQSLVGRDEERCHVGLPSEGGDLGISRVHAELAFSAGGWSLTCMSNGGMWVNQTTLRKDEKYPVKFGDYLKMGKTTFRFGPP